MPELPEVETMKRGIAAIVGSRICAVARPRCRLRPIEISPTLARFRSRAVGRTVVGLDRIGKRVVVELEQPRVEGGDAIVFEPRMTGLVLVAEPPNREHLRFSLQLEGGAASELLFWDRRGLGTVSLVAGESVTAFAEEVAHRYREATGTAPAVFATTPADGVTTLVPA